MPLDDQDMQAIAKLLDDKLAAGQRVERARRRWWLWFWIVVLVLSSALSWWLAQRLLTSFQDAVAAQQQALMEAKLEYQKQLAQNQQMQRERKQTEVNAGYDAGKTDAQHQAAMLRGIFQLFNQQTALNKQLDDLDVSDPAALDAAMKQTSGTANQALGTLMQLLLHETDPANNSRDERKLAGDAPSMKEAKEKMLNLLPSPPRSPDERVVSGPDDLDPKGLKLDELNSPKPAIKPDAGDAPKSK